MYYVYVLINESKKIYIGSTNDLRRRLAEHNRSRSYYLKGHQWKLIYYEAYLSAADAREREQRLKNYGQALAQLKRRIRQSFIQAQVSAG